MDIDQKKSLSYWKERIVNGDNELSSVLYYSGSNILNESYDKWEKEVLEEIINTMKTKAIYALDWPCGNGRHTAFLESKTDKLVSADLDLAILDLVKRKSIKENSNFVKGNIDTIKFEYTYDLILCTGLFEHIPLRQVNNYIKRASENLKENGLFVIAINNSNSKILKKSEDNIYRKGIQLENGYFCNITDLEHVKRCLTENQLNINRIYSNPFMTVLRHLECKERKLWKEAIFNDLKYFNRVNIDYMSDHLILVCEKVKK